jgi:S-adenosylmethionine synthetase
VKHVWIEAQAGWQPIARLRNVIANRVAHAVVKEVPLAEEAYCYLLGRIGKPQVFDMNIRLRDATQREPLGWGQLPLQLKISGGN